MTALYPMVHELFLGWLERTPDRVFLRHLTSAGEEQRTYRHVATTVAATVQALGAGGVRPGDRAIIRAEPVPALHFMLACAFAGVPFAPLAPDASPAAVQRMRRRFAASVLLTAEQAPHLQEPGVAAFFYGDPQVDPEPGAVPFSCPPRPGDIQVLRALCAGRHGREPYIVLATSGTTGEPKLAMRSHQSFSFSAQAFSELLKIRTEPRERVLLGSSLAHGMGQTMAAFAMHLGAELCVPEAMEAAVSLSQVQALDPGLVFAHPRVIESLHRQHLAAGGAPRSRFFGPSLRVLRTGGSPIDPELLSTLASQGVDVGEWYGSSETGMVAMTPRGRWQKGEAGVVCPGIDVMIAEDREILVRSPAQMLGYYGEEPISGAGGLISTGDLGQLGPDRVLRLLGRKKEVLNAPDGSNIAAVPIETMVAALPWVAQVVVVGDRRPFVAALIVVHDAPRSDEVDGFLSRDAAPPVHARARRDLEALNRRLEPIEQIRSFALFGRRFEPGLYAAVAMGKIRRDRPGIDAAYRRRIDAMYEEPMQEVFAEVHHEL